MPRTRTSESDKSFSAPILLITAIVTNEVATSASASPSSDVEACVMDFCFFIVAAS
jgi:hypothetical protein